MKRIYLDHNASTPIDPRVLKVLVEELEEEKGNPSSVHFDGKVSRRKLEESRRTIAEFFGVKSENVIFTSGGTEGAALLIQGLMQERRGHAISSSLEHACVFQTLQALESRGIQTTFLASGLEGAVRPEEVEKAILPNTRLITLMAANNETGVMTDLESMASIAKRANIPFIVDGVAWLGKEKLCVPEGVSALFFSGHKIHAPKGIGCCVFFEKLKLSPLFMGGGQEFNRRSGTENLPGVVALAKAFTLLDESSFLQMRNLRDELERSLIREVPNIIVNGLGPRVSNTSNMAFLGIDGETLLMRLDQEGVSASHGSACASGALEPSRILLDMGIPLTQVQSSLRFSLGRMTTQEEITNAIAIIVRVIKDLHSKK